MNNTTQNKLADMFAKRFEEYNTKVLKELAEVMNKFKGLNYTEAHKLAQQLKFDKSYIDLVDELAKLTGKTKKEIKKILEETVKQHTEFADTFFKARNMDTPIYEKDLLLKDLVNSVAKISEGDFTNIAKSTGFAFMDKNNHIKFLDMKETYYKIIDDCAYAVAEGKETYNNMINNTIRQLVDSGVRRIVYNNEGKQLYTQRLDTAVRRNLFDSIREVSIETQKEFGKRFDADGVEVTVHENPAPDHELVQGHQFTNKEFEKFQNDKDCEDVNGVKYPAISEETKHDRRSIGQYNCYHTVFSIIVGVSRPLYSQKELDNIIERANEEIEIDGKKYTRYETTQLQRQIETQIRYQKEEQMMYLEVGNREKAEKAQLKITQLTRKYKEISNKAGIREQLRQRATISGYKPIKVKEVENIKVSKPNYVKANDKMINNMNEKSIKILNNIDKKDTEALVKYQDIGYQEMAETILLGEPKDFQTYTNVEDIKSDITRIEKVLSNNKTENDLIVFKGTYDLYKDYEIGDIFEIPIFNGTSLKESIAERFATKQTYLKPKETKAILEIRVPKGTEGLYIGDNIGSGMNEYELLLQKDLKYKMVNREEIDPSGYENGVFIHKVKYVKYILEVIK